MNKKAQGTIEFLMTYGWAILVVLVALVALAYFGVLNPEPFLSDKCVVQGNPLVICLGATATEGTLSIGFENIGSEPIFVSVRFMDGEREICESPTSQIHNGMSGVMTFDCDTGEKSKFRADMKVAVNLAGQNGGAIYSGKIVADIEISPSIPIEEVCLLQYPHSCNIVCQDNDGRNTTIHNPNPEDLRTYLPYACDIECDMEKPSRYRLISCDEDFSAISEFTNIGKIQIEE